MWDVIKALSGPRMCNWCKVEADWDYLTFMERLMHGDTYKTGNEPWWENLYWKWVISYTPQWLTDVGANWHRNHHPTQKGKN